MLTLLPWRHEPQGPEDRCVGAARRVKMLQPPLVSEIPGLRISFNGPQCREHMSSKLVGEQQYPLFIEPEDSEHPDLGLLTANRSAIVDLIHNFGAVVLRNWKTDGLDDFVRSLECVFGSEDEGTYYHKHSMLRDGGRKPTAHPNVFSASEAPPGQMIPNHCEQSYLNVRCRYISFWCGEEPEFAGQTPVFDMERVFAALSPKLQARLLESNFKLFGWHFPPKHFELVFGKSDPREVEEVIKKFGMHQQWQTNEDGVRTVCVDGHCPGAVVHPVSGAFCLTDHIDVDATLEWYRRMNFYGFGYMPGFVIRAVGYAGAWYTDFLSSWYANSLHDTLEQSLPSADRRTISGEVLRAASFFKWKKGDVLLIDNIKMAHGRMTFTKPRKILTSMIGLYDARAGSPRGRGEADPLCVVWPDVSFDPATNDIVVRDLVHGKVLRTIPNPRPDGGKCDLRWVRRWADVAPVRGDASRLEPGPH